VLACALITCETQTEAERSPWPTTTKLDSHNRTVFTIRHRRSVLPPRTSKTKSVYCKKIAF
jgi:hypothetical protein